MTTKRQPKYEVVIRVTFESVTLGREVPGRHVTTLSESGQVYAMALPFFTQPGCFLADRGEGRIEPVLPSKQALKRLHCGARRAGIYAYRLHRYLGQEVTQVSQPGPKSFIGTTRISRVHIRAAHREAAEAYEALGQLSLAREHRELFDRLSASLEAHPVLL